jgi:hypothetical protein
MIFAPPEAKVAGPVLVIETSAWLPAGATTMLQLLVAVPLAKSSTLVVKEEVPPAPVGVPLTTPVEAFRIKPAGSDPGAIENV